jgi:serine-type D-Ala-D-Ala carboxypeptidase (penicillin-binding protein 5/6)
MNKNRQKIGLIIIISILLFNSIPVFAWAPGEELSANSVVLMDTIRGQVLYEKEADILFSPSIMCKLMTALVTIEKTQLNAKVTISKNSAGINGSSLNLVVGNLYSVEDLLYGIMLSQGNDSAIALAEYVGDGDVNKFVGYMNDMAKKLMLTDTFFVNPTGLYDKNQFTSTRDIAKLVKTAISMPIFNSIFGARAIAWINGKDSSILSNQNKLFWSYNGVDGGKTGTTPQQGTTSVTTATRNGRRLIAVVFDKNEEATLTQTTKLLDYGFSSYYTGVLVSKDIPLRNITVDNSDVNLISKMDIYYTYPIGESYIEKINFISNDKLTLPITTDTVAGVLNYTLKDGTVIDVNLYSDKEITAPEDYKSKAKKIFEENRDLVTIVIVLVALEIILLIYNLVKLIYKLLKKT